MHANLSHSASSGKMVEGVAQSDSSGSMRVIALTGESSCTLSKPARHSYDAISVN